jgi:voltage-gated sodium channel
MQSTTISSNMQENTMMQHFEIQGSERSSTVDMPASRQQQEGQRYRQGSASTSTSPAPSNDYDLPDGAASNYIIRGGTTSWNGRIVRDNSGFKRVLPSMVSPNSFIRDRETWWGGKLVRNSRFKRAMFSLILVDGLLLGLETFDFVSANDRIRVLFSALNFVFLLLFSFELFLKIFYHGAAFFNSGEMVFDGVVVLLSWIFSFLVVVEPFRVVRTLRLATRIGELRNTALVTYEILPKLLSVGFVMMLSLYIFSVMCTDLFRNTYREGYTSQDYFSSIDVTAFTLFQIMTLDQWSTITREVQQGHRLAWLPFCLFIVASAFCVLNLAVAIVYEAFYMVQRKDLIDKDLSQSSSQAAGDESPSPSNTCSEHKIQPIKEESPNHYLHDMEDKVDRITKVLEDVIALRQSSPTKASI